MSGFAPGRRDETSHAGGGHTPYRLQGSSRRDDYTRTSGRLALPEQELRHA